MAAEDGDRRTILIVDDERDVVLATRIFLEAEGYDVLEAFDGLEALRSLQNVQPDLIVLDVRMPRMNGWKTLEAIQADQRLMDIPVLMLTSMNDPGNMATGINLGCTWYYTKPVTDYADLALVVRRILQTVQPPPGP